MDPLREAVSRLKRTKHRTGACHVSYAPIPLAGFEEDHVARTDSPERWAKIKDGSPNLKGRRFLDIGCATGYFALMAALSGAEAVGIDYDPPQIEVAKLLAERFPQAKVEYKMGDHELVMGQGHFDVAILLNVLHHMHRPQAQQLLQWLSENVDTLWIEAPRDDIGWITKLASGFSDIRPWGETYCPGSGRPQRAWLRLTHDEPFTMGKMVSLTHYCGGNGGGSQSSVWYRPPTKLFPARCYWVNLRPHPRGVEGWRLCKERLGPPHFPQVWEIGKTEKGEEYVAMEWVEGKVPMEWDEKQAQAIYAELKGAKMCHRDYRLANVIQRPNGLWCLIDFGWACDEGDQYPAHGAHLRTDADGLRLLKGALTAANKNNAENWNRVWEKDYTAYLKDPRRDPVYEWVLANMRSHGHREQRILDVGAGCGKFATLAKAEGHDPFVVDISDWAVRFMQEQGFGAQTLDIQKWDRVKLGTFDTVVCLGTLEHIADEEAGLHFMRSHAERGYFMVPHKKLGPASYWHLRAYDHESLAKVLLKHWPIVEISVLGQYLMARVRTK